MSEAGLFAGIATQNAPDDGAVTSKPPGFSWFEWDTSQQSENTSGEFSVTTGRAATSDELYVVSPIKSLPMLGQSYAEFTMSTVFQSTLDPTNGVFQSAYGVAETMRIGLQNTGGARRLGVTLVAQTAAQSNVNIISHTLLLDSIGTGTGGWRWFHWYCLTVCYSQALDLAKVAWVNLSLGEEVVTTPTVVNNVDVEFHVNQCGNQQAFSNMGYGGRVGLNATTMTQPWTGTLANSYVHNRYADLGMEANRRKFCGIDGVIDIGFNGTLPFDEVPLIFLPTGIPNDQRGTLFIGNYPADFYVLGIVETDTNLPPVAS